jgi:Trypsin-like peptidase domain
MPCHISTPSAQSLYVEIRANGLQIGNATAFAVLGPKGNHFLVTNRHVVTGRHQITGDPLDKKHSAIPDELVVWQNSAAELGFFIPVPLPLQRNGQNTWTEHPTLGSAADIVAFPVTESTEVRLLPYRLDAFVHGRMHPSQRVSVVGFPFGERIGQSFALWATGFVASEPEIDHGGRPVFLIDCRTRPGQSGAPVIHHEEVDTMFAASDGGNETLSNTQLLGLYSGRINEQSDIGIVWKTYAIAELVAAASVSPSAP